MDTGLKQYFRILFVPHPRLVRWWYEIQINAPRVCPVCGSKDVTKQIKLGASNLGFLLGPSNSNSMYIKIWVCKAHEKLKTPHVQKLREASICFEYFQERSVIHVAREDWVGAFTAQNPLSSVIAGCRPFDVNGVPLTKRVLRTFVAWVASIGLLVASFAVSHEVGRSIWMSILITTCTVMTITLILVFGIGVFYLSLHKLPILREIAYFGSRLRDSWRDYIRDPVSALKFGLFSHD